MKVLVCLFVACAIFGAYQVTCEAEDGNADSVQRQKRQAFDEDLYYEYKQHNHAPTEIREIFKKLDRLEVEEEMVEAYRICRHLAYSRYEFRTCVEEFLLSQGSF